MLLSMTGFGEAHGQQDGLVVAVEVRAINSRFFKLSVRATEGYASLEPHIEEIARQSIRRGTVQVNLRVDRLRSCQDFRINSDVLGGYRDQLQSLYHKWDQSATVSLEALLPLPGVVNDQSMILFSPEDDWPAISKVLHAAWRTCRRCGFAKARPWPMTCRPIAARLPPAWRRSSGGRRWSWTPIARDWKNA